MAQILDNGLIVSDFGLLYPGSIAFDFAVENLPPPPGWYGEAHRRSGDMAILGDENGLLRMVSRTEYWENLFDNPLYYADDAMSDDISSEDE
jgi:hypothetical protein